MICQQWIGKWDGACRKQAITIANVDPDLSDHMTSVRMPHQVIESSFIMDRPEVRQYINYLHDRFVIVPVDKASNNLVSCACHFI